MLFIFRQKIKYSEDRLVEITIFYRPLMLFKTEENLTEISEVRVTVRYRQSAYYFVMLILVTASYFIDF